MELRKNLYDYALQQKACTPEMLIKAQRYAEANRCSAQKALKETAALTDEKILELMGLMYGYQTISDVRKISLDEVLMERFETERLQELKMIPCHDTEERLQVAIANPVLSLAIEDYVKEVLRKPVKIEYLLITEQCFAQLLSRNNQHLLPDTLKIEEDVHTEVYDVAADDPSQIVSLVNRICSEAIRMRASDIHIEPLEHHSRVRFRIDGCLMEVMKLPGKLHGQIVNRIKTLCNMDVNNTRTSQNGGIRLKRREQEIDLRVSTLPTVHGRENVTIRILDGNAMQFDQIDLLYLAPGVRRKFENIIHKQSGIMLISGPTGAGKSSTLQFIMAQLNDMSRCIITLEQPVEYRMDGLVQVPIDEAAGVTFERVLKDSLRQDPDILCISEIRDETTARIAIQASNTGHQVFGSVHCNAAASAVTRLVEMGIEPFYVSETLNGVMNQRLVRRICPECKEEYGLTVSSPFYKVLNRPVRLYRGKGCSHCNGTGYRGRIAIQELLVIDEEIREALSKGAATTQLQKIAVSNGMRTIEEDGIAKSLAGLTTLEEIHRVLHFDYLNKGESENGSVGKEKCDKEK